MGYDRRARLELVEVRARRPRRARGGEGVAAGAPGALEDGRAVGAQARETTARGVPALAGDGGDIRGDVERVLALDDVRRHLRLHFEVAQFAVRVGGDRAGSGAEPDLVEDDVLDDTLRIALLHVGRERVGEVRAEGPARAGRRESVASPAALREELLAGLRVGPLPAGVRRAA